MPSPAIESLRNVIAPDRILTNPETLATYALDWTRFYTPNAMAVVFPKTIEEVQAIVQWARKEKFALVPSGGRTGLSAGAVAANGEVVVSMEKMNQIINCNPIERTITCQPGVITEALQNYAKEQGFYFPVDFAARGSSQIGGNVATNSGGIKVIRYGLMRDWIAGLKVVTGAGDLLELNGSLVKNASGYDLRQLFIGSEGTLGFIVEVILKVTAPPPPSQVMVLAVPNLEAIMKIYNKFRNQTEVTAFEMFCQLALDHVLKQGHVSNPLSTATPYYLLVEVETPTDEKLEAALEIFGECAENEWVLDGVVSQTTQQAKDLWRLREDVSESITPYTPYKNDISVPISQVPQFITELDKVLAQEYPTFPVVWFGHIGDGNLHISILKPNDLSREAFLEDCHRADTLVFECVKKFHGSISAEHGVGLLKKPYLSFTRSPAEVRIMKGIKHVFDPDNILNPGKIFD